MALWEGRVPRAAEPGCRPAGRGPSPPRARCTAPREASDVKHACDPPTIASGSWWRSVRTGSCSVQVCYVYVMNEMGSSFLSHMALSLLSELQNPERMSWSVSSAFYHLRESVKY